MNKCCLKIFTPFDQVKYGGATTCDLYLNKNSILASVEVIPVLISIDICIFCIWQYRKNVFFLKFLIEDKWISCVSCEHYVILLRLFTAEKN